MTPTRFAFYGTLMVKPGSHRDSWMGLMGEPVGECRIRGDLFSVSDSFPALVPGDGVVIGQLWEPFEGMEDVATRQFDQIEGYHPQSATQSHYLRVETELIEPEGVTAWTYVYNYPTDGLLPIDDGDWLRYADSLAAWWKEASR